MKILETERLILKTIEEEERFEDLESLLANENVQRLFPKALNRQETQGFLNAVQKRQTEDGISFWAVIRKEE